MCCHCWRLHFYAGEAPGGTIEFVFSGNAALRLDMEYIESALTDLGPVWQAVVRIITVYNFLHRVCRQIMSKY